MKQYEYGNFMVWGLGSEGGKQKSRAFTLQDAGGHSYLRSTTRLDALNEIGLDGWVVYYYDEHAYGYYSEHAYGVFPSQLVDEHESRNGFRPRGGCSLQLWEVRRVKPSAPCGS